MKAKLALLWSALFCTVLVVCCTSTSIVPSASRVCDLSGMPFMVSEVSGSQPEAWLCTPPNKQKPFVLSSAYSGLNLTKWLADKDVDAQSFGLDWIATAVEEGQYWRLRKFVPGSTSSGFEGWGAILYGDAFNIYAYAWGDVAKLKGLALSPGHQLLHKMVAPSYVMEGIDAIDFNAWVFSGPPLAQCYSPHPLEPGQEYDPTLIYSIPGTGAISAANSGATLWGIRPVSDNGAWVWPTAPFLVAEPGDLGLQLTDDIDTLAFDRRQGLLMFSLTTTGFKVMEVEEKPTAGGFRIALLQPAHDLEDASGKPFGDTGPLTSKPTTGCAIDPSKFNWIDPSKDDEPKEASAAR